ncbi:MAG: phenylalanine--tRNA ligase subunit alpha [Fidelibacterota bacterium]
MQLKESVESVREQFRADTDPFPTSANDVEVLRIKYFGRKGLVTNLFMHLKNAPVSEKPALGKVLNELKKELDFRFEKLAAGSAIRTRSEEAIDYTLPGIQFPQGHLHPLQQILDEIKSIFKNIGFGVAYGPEIEDDFHNFSALNFPPDHPARDMQDTFFINQQIVLRTHTSNVQIHLMEDQQPPLRYIIPGRVYRNEAISFKSYCLFHQVEGLFVDEKVSFADLKGTLEYFIKRMFGGNTKTRFRPSFFPFTEPSAEVDMWNEKRGQWMEILGCGMVDPAVFRSVDYDPQRWHGYAFGMGIERIAMLKYGIDDIRMFFQGDVRFLEQF